MSIDQRRKQAADLLPDLNSILRLLESLDKLPPQTVPTVRANIDQKISVVSPILDVITGPGWPGGASVAEQWKLFKEQLQAGRPGGSAGILRVCITRLEAFARG